MPKGKNSKRIRLAEAQNWRCAYCSGLMHDDGTLQAGATIEHVVPIILGGGCERENLVSACLACNGARSAFYSARAFNRIRRWLVRNGQWPPCTYPNKKVRRRILIIFAEAERLRALKLSSTSNGETVQMRLLPNWPTRNGANLTRQLPLDDTIGPPGMSIPKALLVRSPGNAMLARSSVAIERVGAQPQGNFSPLLCCVG